MMLQYCQDFHPPMTFFPKNKKLSRKKAIRRSHVELLQTANSKFKTIYTSLCRMIIATICSSVLKGVTKGIDVGKRIVLPGSFIGGPRDMCRKYLDALALVQRFGKLTVVAEAIEKLELVQKNKKGKASVASSKNVGMKNAAQSETVDTSIKIENNKTSVSQVHGKKKRTTKKWK